MASDKIEYSRLLMKRSTTTGEVPTIPPITAVTLNQFTPTDIFEGEFFLNSADDLLWIRTENGILPISLSGSTGTTVTPTLTQVLYEGNTTNGYDIVVSSGDTVVFEGLTTGVSTNILAIDVSGNTIITSVSGSTGSSGTSGTSGSSGTSGVNGISAGRTYYFNQSQASDIADYKVLSDEPSTATTQTITVSLPGSTNDNFVQQFITPQLGFNVIPSGVQRFYLQFTKPAENDDISAYIVLQLTDFSGGTIGSPITSSIQSIGWNGTNPYELLIDVVLPTTAIDPTNRMSVAIYLNNYNASTHNTTFYTENGNYSFVITSVGVVAGTSGTSGINGSNGTSGTSGISGGDSLWTSGSSVGSVVTVAGNHTLTSSRYDLVSGSGNTINQWGPVAFGYNGVFGKNNQVYGEYNIVQGYNNSISGTNYNFVVGVSNTGTTTFGRTFIFGDQNYVFNDQSVGYGNAIFGRFNQLTAGNVSSFISGNSNKIDSSLYSAIIGGSSNFVNDVDRSVILGGQGITATTSNMTYVPNLTIVSATTGTSVASLGIDSTGKVITTSGGTSTTNTGTHFNSSLIAGYEYSLAITSNPQQIGIYSGAIVISPFTPGRNISISALTADIFSTAAGAEMKLVAYSNDPTRLGPGSIIIESPVFDLSVNPFTIRQYNVNYTFQAGTTYWLGIAANSAASGVQMRGMNISSTFAFGVPSVSGSGWIYNMCYSTISAWPSLPTPSSISPNWAPLPEVRIKVAS